MRFLFLHPSFAGQFEKLIRVLAQNPAHEVVHCCNRSAIENIPNVRKITYSLPDSANSPTHLYVKKLDDAVRQGQVVLDQVRSLKDEGFVPDIIYGYAGWGSPMFMKDLYPKTPLLCYFEWFQNAFGGQYNFDPERPLSFELQQCLRVHNAPDLIDLYSCDAGITPTHWQKQQFPESFHPKLTVLHDGVDTDYYAPSPGKKLVLLKQGLDLSHVEELVTYTTRGLEPVRGFPQLMHAIKILQENRPQCHVVIVGTENVFYSKRAEAGKTYKQSLLDELSPDLSRIHFIDWLPLSQYREVLQASSVHVYLTYPYVLSWSVMEAMSSGCVVVGSDTPPVREVITDGQNGVLVDFFSPEALAAKINDLLDSPERRAELSQNARETMMEQYAFQKLLPKHLELMDSLVGSAACHR
jgi:glycosyltransferase involved in cell wall biosynthesis